MLWNNGNLQRPRRRDITRPKLRPRTLLLYIFWRVSLAFVYRSIAYRINLKRLPSSGNLPFKKFGQKSLYRQTKTYSISNIYIWKVLWININILCIVDLNRIVWSYRHNCLTVFEVVPRYSQRYSIPRFKYCILQCWMHHTLITKYVHTQYKIPLIGVNKTIIIISCSTLRCDQRVCVPETGRRDQRRLQRFANNQYL